VAQVVEPLPSKWEALISNPSTVNKRNFLTIRCILQTMCLPSPVEHLVLLLTILLSQELSPADDRLARTPSLSFSWSWCIHSLLSCHPCPLTQLPMHLSAPTSGFLHWASLPRASCVFSGKLPNFISPELVLFCFKYKIPLGLQRLSEYLSSKHKITFLWLRHQHRVVANGLSFS
jgi:hypothetical protein